MGKEIERKYLVADDSFVSMATHRVEIAQGYLSTDPDRTVRVRIKDAHGYITVKSRNVGAVRDEWEYEIPVVDAYDMIQRCCVGVLQKYRYYVPFDGRTWEVDAFRGRHLGLVIAEIELADEHDTYALPPFVSEEVTGDPRYYNSNLAKTE